MSVLFGIVATVLVLCSTVVGAACGMIAARDTANERGVAVAASFGLSMAFGLTACAVVAFGQ